MNLHNDDDNVNDGDIHDIIFMLAYNLHAHIMAVVIMVFSVSDVCIKHYHLLWCFQYQIYTCIQHDQLLWCFQHQTYVYSMIS